MVHGKKERRIIIIIIIIIIIRNGAKTISLPTLFGRLNNSLIYINTKKYLPIHKLGKIHRL